MTSAARFISAFNDIENHLREELGAPPERGFKSLLDEYATVRRLPARHRVALETFARLRNTISHSRYRDGLPIADPRADTLEHIERLRNLLVTPPRALEAIHGPGATPPPATVAPSDPISVALAYVRDHDYSQFPIYDGSTYVGLLTTNTIARWLAQQFDDFGGEAASERVSHVHAHREGDEHVVAAAPDLTALAAIDLLTDVEQPARAILITPGAARDELPLSLIVRADLHRLYQPFAT